MRSVYIIILLLAQSALSFADAYKLSADPWNALYAHDLSSVAWSPDGKQIAFVATTTHLDEHSPVMWVDSAAIWLLDAKSTSPVLKKLVKLPTKSPSTNIPVGMFWLDNNRLGWAASLGFAKCGFFCISLQDKNPKTLVNKKFISSPNQRTDQGDYGGFDDVYWDAGSQSILFTGSNDTPYSMLRILHLPDEKLREFRIDDAKWFLHLSASLSNPKKLTFFVTTGGGIWESNSYSLEKENFPVERSTQGDCIFPRLSPDGKLLAWMQTPGSYDNTFTLYVKDLKSGKSKRLAEFYAYCFGGNPALGCPYSWSPDSTSIAYADSLMIKIVKAAVQ